MKLVEYDRDADAIYVAASNKKAYYSVEISPNIIVDISDSKKVVGVEMLEASKALSELMGRSVSKNELAKLGCQVSESDIVYLRFSLGHEKASLGLPKAYDSPVLSITSQ